MSRRLKLLPSMVWLKQYNDFEEFTSILTDSTAVNDKICEGGNFCRLSANCRSFTYIISEPSKSQKFSHSKFLPFMVLMQLNLVNIIQCFN